MFNLITRQPLRIDMSMFHDPRDPPVRETSASVQRAKTAQFVERFAVIWPECAKSPKDGLHALALILGEEAVQALAIYTEMENEYGSATMAREFEAFIEARK